MDLTYLVALNCAGFNSKDLLKLLEKFETARRIWHTSVKELRDTKLVSEKKINSLEKWKQDQKHEKIFSVITKKDIKVISIFDKKYPNLLKKIYDPPALLYYRGRLSEYNLPIAIVGSRKSSSYGKKVAEGLAKKLAENGFTIISGMARGIDSYSHKGALAAGEQTIAILGNGVDIIYPPENKGLYEQIIDNGCVMSEFPPGTAPQNWHFPARNRIISGISKAVIVVEAALKSGALITVDYALEQGRDVFSVPGPITSKYSSGTNNLIKQGAKPLTCIEDILEDFNVKTLFPDFEPQKKPDIKLTKAEQLILSEIESEPCEIDSLIQKTGFTPSDINAACIILEMKGLIRKIPGKKYIKANL